VVPATAVDRGAPPTPPNLGVDEVARKAGHENFPVALRLLRRDTRDRLAAIYGFARLVDDVGDLAPGDRPAQLDWLEADLERAFAGHAEHPLVARLTPVVRDLRLGPEPFRRLIRANRRDQLQARYTTYAELADYCSLSANPVGELVLCVFGALTSERLRRSDAVCTGLQLAEHLQDVGEDLARGRVYLPREDLRRFGVTESALREGRRDEAFRALMAFQVDRARALLGEGTPLVASLRGRARVAVAAYVAGGRAALAAVERSGYDVLERSPTAGSGRRLLEVVRVLQEAAA
jgi:squalene synthase HpnC